MRRFDVLCPCTVTVILHTYDTQHHKTSVPRATDRAVPPYTLCVSSSNHCSVLSLLFLRDMARPELESEATYVSVQDPTSSPRRNATTVSPATIIACYRIGSIRLDIATTLRVLVCFCTFLVSPDRGSFKQDLRAVPPFPFYCPITVDTTYYYTTILLLCPSTSSPTRRKSTNLWKNSPSILDLNESQEVNDWIDRC